MAGQSTFSIEKFSLSQTVVDGKPQWSHVTRPNLYLIVDSSPLRMASSRRSPTCRTLKVMENATCLESVNIEELSRNTQIAIRDAKAKGIELVPAQHLVSAHIRYPHVALRYSATDSQTPRRLQVKLTSDQDYNFVVDFLKDVQCHITLQNDVQRPATSVGTSNANLSSNTTTPFPFGVLSNNYAVHADDVGNLKQPQSYVQHYHQTSYLPQDQQSQSQQYPQFSQQGSVRPQPIQYSEALARQQPDHYPQFPPQYHGQHQPRVLQSTGFHSSSSDPSQPVQQYNLRFPNYSTLPNLEGNIGFNGLLTNSQTMASPSIPVISTTSFARPNSRPSTAPMSQMQETMLGQLSRSPAEVATSSRPTSKAARPVTAGAKNGLPTPRSSENNTNANASKSKAVKKAPGSTAKDRRALNVRDGNATSRPRSRSSTAASKAKSTMKGIEETANAECTEDMGILPNAVLPKMLPPSTLRRSTSAKDQATIHDNTRVESPINRVTAPHDVANAREMLAAYADQNDPNRQQALEELIFEAMNSEGFIKLCEEVEGSWRMIGLPGL